jgi:hypothetical protein
MSYINKYSNGFVVTPNDGADLPNGPCTALRCTSAGVVAVNIRGGSQGVLMPISPNEDTFLPIQRVLATGTTATGLFAFY